MKHAVRQSVRVILLNAADEVLLMCMDDPNIHAVGEQYSGPFWTLIGESQLQAAVREVFEDTGLGPHDIELGPVVWIEQLELVLHGCPTRIEQQYIAARTTRTDVTMAHLTQHEPSVVKRLSWFSLDEIAACSDKIYPVGIVDYLPDVIAGKSRVQPLDISSS